MERPQLVYVGGNDRQPIKPLYLGTDGDKAEKVFAAAAADGNNQIVRHCMFFEHVRIATPAADGVSPKPKKGKPQAEGSQEPEGDQEPDDEQ